MAVTLQKGGNLSLSKTDPDMTQILVGLGWDPRVTDGVEFDLDASAFLLDNSGKVRNEKDFIFYNQLIGADGAVCHLGDNRTGEGDGDDEQITVALTDVPAVIDKVVFTVTIHDAEARKQNFGQVGSAYIRVVNHLTGVEIARFDLAEDASTETAMLFGELYRSNGEWKFRAVGQGFVGGLKAMTQEFGIQL